MIKSAQIISCAIALACSALTAWSAVDVGGAYYITQMQVALFLLVAGLLASLSLSKGSSDGVKRGFVSRRDSLTPPLLVVIAMAIWGAGMFQTLPLSSGIAAMISPGSSEIYSDWLPEAVIQELLDSDDQRLIAVAESAPEVKTSIATTYTRLALLGPAAFAAMCWICFLSFRCLQAILVFLSVIAGSGAVFSFFGLIDTLRLVRDWQFELRQMLIISPVGADDPFGPFVNNNNASGFLCLAIGCALGLLVLGEHLLARKEHREAEDTRGFSAGLLIARIASVAVIAILVAGVIGSNSRGGFLGLLAGSLVVAVFWLPRFGKLKSTFVIFGLVSLSWLIISGLGFGERSQGRAGTLLDKQILEDPRLDHWSDALVAAGHYLPFGSGLGTYRYACLPFQENGAPLWFVNADGMPIEWLVEGGVWLLPLIAFAFGILLQHVRRIGIGLSPISPARLSPDLLAYAKCIWVVALFSIPALVVTQCFDFGITLMPLLLTFSGICAAVLRISSTVSDSLNTGGFSRDDGSTGNAGTVRKSEARTTIFSRFRKSRFYVVTRKGLVPALLVLVALALGLSAKELYVASVSQQEDRWLRQQRKHLLADMPGLSQRLVRLEQLALANPTNALVWKSLAKFRLAEQQRLGAVQLLELQPATVDSHARWVAPATARHATYTGKDADSFSSCLLPTQDIEQWRQARQELHAALLLNPLDDSLRVSIVELDMVASDAKVASRDLLMQAARLRPRTEPFLKYLIWLAQDYPGKQHALELESMLEMLRQERQP